MMAGMKLYVDIHPTQVEVMKWLMFHKAGRFSQLNTQGLGSDSFSFHLRRLLTLGLIEKHEDQYRLSVAGKEFANRFDVDDRAGLRQGKLSVMLVPMREPNGSREYLIRHRLKQPYFDYCGFITGKVRNGETVLEAAARELKEETGLQARLEYIGIQHKLDYTENHQLLEDKYFFVVLATDTAGDFKEAVRGGRNLWLSAEQVEELPKLFQGTDTSLRLVQDGQQSFTETEFVYSEIDY